MFYKYDWSSTKITWLLLIEDEILSLVSQLKVCYFQMLKIALHHKYYFIFFFFKPTTQCLSIMGGVWQCTLPNTQKIFDPPPIWAYVSDIPSPPPIGTCVNLLTSTPSDTCKGLPLLCHDKITDFSGPFSKPKFLFYLPKINVSTLWAEGLMNIKY